MELRNLPWYFWIGISAFLVFWGLLLSGDNIFSIYFYVFVWWAYIITVDGLVLQIKGSSLLTRLRVKTFPLIFASTAFWTFFEVLNWRIANWRYTGPSFSHPIGKIIFAIIAFGTVLPGVMVTFEALETLGLWQNIRFPRWRWWGHPRGLWMILGVAMIVMSLMWPKYFFWMVWIALIFVLDPSVEKNGGKSVLSELRRGKAETICLLIATGFICGLLWEFWNYWAGLRWRYSVPFVSGRKIFEMPILGYLGFLPFTVECFVFYQWLGCQKSQLMQKLQVIKKMEKGSFA